MDPLDDERIIELFFERSEQAIKALAEKYGRVFMKVSVNAVGSVRDAEECVNDSYLKVWNAIPPARPARLLAYVCRIVRNASIDRCRSRGFSQWKSNYAGCVEELSGLISGGDTPEDAADERLLSGYIDEFIDEQNEVNAMIFVRRFFYMDTCEDIAEASGLSSGAVRTRLTRIKAEL